MCTLPWQRSGKSPPLLSITAYRSFHDEWLFRGIRYSCTCKGTKERFTIPLSSALASFESDERSTFLVLTRDAQRVLGEPLDRPETAVTESFRKIKEESTPSLSSARASYGLPDGLLFRNSYLPRTFSILGIAEFPLTISWKQTLAT